MNDFFSQYLITYNQRKGLNNLHVKSSTKRIVFRFRIKSTTQAPIEMVFIINLH